MPSFTLSRILLFLVILFLSLTSANAQKSASVWIFGQKAGLNFATSTGAPTPLLNPNINTTEGCATLSDENGNLLFYTDGVTVWNKSHQVMKNGSGLFGAQSSTQSAVIVQLPGKPHVFFIFTVQDHLLGNNSLYYSEVDMTDDGGLGGIKGKNILLATPCAEKITAIPHNNGKDTWIVTHKLYSNQFAAFLLSPDGFKSTIPVISSVGQTHTNMLGYLRASHKGDKLALAVTFEHPGVETFDFNQETGVVSNAKTYNIGGAYGVEFSPNDQFLYISTTWGLNSIYQINLASQAFAPLTTNTGGNYTFGALQLGPDGKIYMARNERNFLDAIVSPNLAGQLANYQSNYQPLAQGATCKLGLPNFVKASAEQTPIVDFNFTFNCSTNQFLFETDGGGTSLESYSWNFGDLPSGNQNVSTETSASHRYSTEGTYTVTLSATYNGQVYSKSKQVTFVPSPIINLGADILICNGQPVTLASNAQAGSSLRWSTGAISPSILVTQSGTYWVEATRGQCTVRDEVNVVINPPVALDLGPDKFLCSGETLTLSPTLPTNSTILWSNGSTNPSLTVNASGTYWAEITQGLCTFRDEITVIVEPLLEVDLGPDVQLCAGESLTLSPQVPPNTTFKWSDGSTGNTLVVSAPGLYKVELSNRAGCTIKDEISVEYNPLPTLELGPDRQICQGESILLSAENPNFTYLWQDGSVNPTFLATTTGKYSVNVTNEFGCQFTDSVFIQVNPLPVINLGPDRSLCVGEKITLGNTIPNATYRWQDGSTNATLSPTTSGVYWQEATVNGCTTRDEISVTFNPLPVFNLGNDTTLCVGQQFSLDVTQPNATYVWSNGSSAPTSIITEAGTYWVEVTNEFNCTTRDEVDVFYLTPPTIELGNDTTLCHGETLQIGQVLPGVTYVWQDGSTNPLYSVTKPGTYRVTASLQHCSETDVINVKFKDCRDGLFIPNIITPNEDGSNDVFFIHGLHSKVNGLENAAWELTVFDRWGKQVYKTSNYRNTWNGETLSEGMYFYYLTNKEQERYFKGWLEIVR